MENFLQSDIWQKFQEAVGHRTFSVSLPHPSPLPNGEGDFIFSASIVEHQLPIIGNYLYVPRGPIIGNSNDQISTLPTGRQVSNQIPNLKSQINLLIDLAKKENAGWIRIEPENAEVLEIIKKNVDCKIINAPHDMQPKEILVMNIAKTEEELLSGMKSKTRYNIRLATRNSQLATRVTRQKEDADAFIRLVELTAERKKIKFHPENYYRKMLEIISDDILKLYVAEYENKIIAANLMIFHGDTATYLHGATDDEYRNVMAPYLLQWQAIKDAKKAGYKFYDFGGVCSGPTALDRNSLKRSDRYNSWYGITKFKTGFAPTTQPLIFPGSYDIIMNKKKYYLYRVIQKIKCFLN